jgi:hypothetical protein
MPQPELHAIAGDGFTAQLVPFVGSLSAGDRQQVLSCMAKLMEMKRKRWAS